MKKFFVFTCLLASQALGKPSKRADPRAADEGHGGECCAEKKVGNVLYQLFSEGDASQLARYNCLNGCIYKDEENPQGASFCFAHGDLPVECMDDFHWCYEGNCGPEFWETRFEDCAGESQSPIDVQWPEDSLANARPAQLNFEGYDRLRAVLTHDDADTLPGKDDRLNGHVSNNGHTAVLGVVQDDARDGVMTGSADGLAVVGQMFEISNEDNEVLTPLIESLANIV